MVAKPVQYRKRGVLYRIALAGGVLFLVAFMGMLLASNIKMTKKAQELQETKSYLSEKKDNLAREQDDLRIGVAQMQSAEYQEKVLREKGLYKKPGEEVITVLSPKNVSSKISAEKTRVWWNPFTW